MRLATLALFIGFLLAPRPAAAAGNDSTLVRRNHPIYVRIDLDSNTLSVMSGDHQLWSAPVGTGTGLRLQGARKTWEFTTPHGEYAVMHKELDPVWVRPDWYYLEKGLPVPPDTSSQRFVAGELGAAAIYFAPELAIHGTSHPELLGQNVSHGCIRLANEDVMRLYHVVRLGTPVVVTGTVRPRGDTTRALRPVRKAQRIGAAYSNGQRMGQDTTVSTDTLLARFDVERTATYRSSDWTLTAGELVERGIRGDARAIRGLLERSSSETHEWAYEREFSTFLAGLYFRRPVEVLARMGRMEPGRRAEVAFAIVRATLDLYPGSLNARTAPWPSALLPEWRLEEQTRVGLAAIREAEERYRVLFSVPASEAAEAR